MEHMENVCIQSVWDYGGNLAKETPALKDSQWLRAANGWMRTKLCSREFNACLSVCVCVCVCACWCVHASVCVIVEDRNFSYLVGEHRLKCTKGKGERGVREIEGEEGEGGWK